MAIVIALDAGTTGVRSIAFDETGSQLRSAYRELTQHFPQPGWVEHDPTEIWDATAATLREVVDQVGEPVAAIGITNQRETLVSWDRRTHEPLHRALVWQDRRTSARCAELAAAGHEDTIRATTGLVIDPYFTATKAEWLFRELGAAAGPDTAIGTVDSWLVWKLTAGRVHATDSSNASRTMLYDIGERRWSDELLDLFGVPLSALPEVVPSSGRIATTAGDLPVPAGVPVSGIAGDQQAALFGQACFAVGDTKNTYGTGSFVLMNVGTARPDPGGGLLATIAWTIGDETVYALEGSIFSTGSAVQWLRDGLGIIDAASETEALALQCDDTGGVMVVPAFTGLGSPWWDPHARATVLGLTRGSGRPQLARAVVESMAYQTRDVVEAMRAAGDAPLTTLRIDGGAAAMDLLVQIQADQLQAPVTRAAYLDTTALGAAYLAGIGEGVWDGTDDVAARWQSDLECTPAVDADTADAAYAQWLRAVSRARGWLDPAEDDAGH